MILALATLGATSHTQASIILTLPTISTTGSLQITEDINFQITTTGFFQAIILDEWVVSNFSTHTIGGSPYFTPDSIEYEINGSLQTVGIQGILDNWAGFISDATPNDGSLIFDHVIEVTVGQVLTIKAGNYTFGPGLDMVESGFNPQGNQTFSGNVFLVDGSLNRVSDTVALAVPELSQTLLLGFGGIVMMLCRRRI
jgi:hypothetical protein